MYLLNAELLRTLFVFDTTTPPPPRFSQWHYFVTVVLLIYCTLECKIKGRDVPSRLRDCRVILVCTIHVLNSLFRLTVSILNAAFR